MGSPAHERFDPWIEIYPQALRSNISEIKRLTLNRPILAVIKNNAYGLGLVNAASILEPMPEVAGFAVVKLEAAIALRDAGVKKPVLLMAMFSAETASDLVHNDIQPSLYSANALDLVREMARVNGAPIAAQIYFDTGMSRMGVPYHTAIPWIESLAESGFVSFDGCFTGFTEEPEFDREQLRRFLEVTGEAENRGTHLGQKHAASSSGIFEFPNSHLDLFRPGMAMYGGYPNDPRLQKNTASLKSTFSLKARVVRVEKLRQGDSVSYGRNYVATKPVWIATLPVGHTDGMPRTAVDGGKVLIGKSLYPVIGSVSASHTIVEIGDEQSVEVGDIATLMGRGAEEVNPNWVSTQTGASVYDLFMHLNPTLPRFIID